jgi:outer membrane protein assembly factor BamB
LKIIKSLKYAVTSSLVVAGLTFPVSAQTTDWPMFQNNPAHTGQGTNSRTVKNPVIRWKQPVGVAGWLNSPIIADGQVFIGSSGYLWQIPDYDEGNESESLITDGVYAFDLKTGKKNWYAPAWNDVNAVAYDKNRVFATGDEGAIWAINAQTGEEIWKQKLGAETYQLLVHNNRVYVGTAKGLFTALDATTGKILWQVNLKGSIRAGAALKEDILVLGTTEGHVYGINLNGKIRWEKNIQKLYSEYQDEQYPVAIEVYASATIYQNKAIISFARDTLYPTPAMVALDYKTGKLIWKAENDGQRAEWGNIRTSPALYKNILIYAEPYSNDLIAINADTGKALGSQGLGVSMFPQWPSPALSGSLVIIPRHDGGLYSLTADKGKPDWEFYIGEPHLAGKNFPEGIASGGGGSTFSHPNIGDAVFTSPAISEQGYILVAAAGYLYCIGDQSW